MIVVKKVLIKEDVLIEKRGGVLLAGSRCKKNGHIFFPPRAFCVECFESEMEVCEIGNRGTLYSYTTSYLPAAHLPPPYTAGWILMNGQIKVFAPIVMEEEQRLKIGMPMKLVTNPLWEDNEKQVLGYAFKPDLKENLG